jgi:hypothetical protein
VPLPLYFTVQFAVESVSSLRWNGCPVCRGMRVQFGAEFAHLVAGLRFQHVDSVLGFGHKVGLVLQMIRSVLVVNLKLPFCRLKLLARAKN